MFTKITADEFSNVLGEDDVTIIDTRPPDSFESWHVPGAENVPFGITETLDDERAAEVADIADGDTIVTICGKGATSTTFAAELDAAGYDDVAVVKGGMRDWNSLYRQTQIDTDSSVRIVQFQRRGKGCLSYLVAAPNTGEAVVVDPTRHTDQYVVAAAEHGVDITHVLDTHIHADHVSGGRRLADRLDVPYHLGERATERDPGFEFVPVEDGDVVSLGGTAVTVLEAPGHTSEMVNYRVGDEAILTGDALFLDSVGRTELEFGEDDAERGAAMAYETLHDTLFELPDDIAVLPSHVTVTSDGRFEHGSPGEAVAAAMGRVHERLDLTGRDREAFVEALVENVPEKPDNYETILDFNTSHDYPESSRTATQLETGANNCSA